MPHDHPTPLLAKRTGPSKQPTLVTLLLAFCLAGCGGGGGGGSGGTTSTNTAPPTPLCSQLPVAEPHNSFEVDCDGANCGALNSSTYSGSGVGAWRYTNTTSTPTQVAVGISGTLGKDVTLVMTNQSCANTPLASVVSPNLFANMSSPNTAVAPNNEPGVNHIPDQVRRFQLPALEHRNSNDVARSLVGPSSPMANNVSDSRNWYDHNDQERTATLFEIRTASDGRRINFWVENGEYGPGKVTSEQLQELADAFAIGPNAVYNMVTSLAGQPWGLHIYNNLIGPTQPIDIVLLNLTPDNDPWGLVGFFWGRNNFLTSTEQYSNESLSFYLDTETLYLDDDGTPIENTEGLRFEISTLAHELVHMINFYQRAIVRSTQSIDYSFDQWLEEMTALMMEDIVGTRLDPSYHVILDDRFPKWLAGEFNCDITAFDDDIYSPCFGYNLTGSFGAWLLRHYGIDFYKSLLNNTSSTDSIAVLDDAIRDYGGSGFKDAIRRWGTLLALVPAASSPSLFGLPERNDQGYTLPAIDGSAYINERILPAIAPNPLLPNGHYPRVVTSGSDPFVETVTVPPNTTLTVIVQ